MRDTVTDAEKAAGAERVPRQKTHIEQRRQIEQRDGGTLSGKQLKNAIV